MRPMTLFTIATLTPLPLIMLAALTGGWWALLAPLYMTLMTASLDEMVKRITPTVPEAEFPVADRLSVAIALGQFCLLGAVTYGTGHGLSSWEKVGVFVATGLYLGQVGNSNAHELIHRGSRFLHDLGMWAYISVLFGHHTSAHVLIHHRFVATKSDPNSARKGESFYRFAPRAWIGSFRAGLRAESERLKRAERASWRHPYIIYIGGALLMICAAYLIGGKIGLFWYLAIAGFAQVQLLMSDYVQHYGLQRHVTEDGKAEPVAGRHSWNCPHWFSSALMLNAPRHSDHHAHPARPYPALELGENPMLPRSLPVMACVALYPRFWRKVMDPRAAKWRSVTKT